MTNARCHISTRSEVFRMLSSMYAGLAKETALCEIERACYDDVAGMLAEVEDRFDRAALELDDQLTLAGITSPRIRVIPIGVAS